MSLREYKKMEYPTTFQDIKEVEKFTRERIVEINPRLPFQCMDGRPVAKDSPRIKTYKKSPSGLGGEAGLYFPLLSALRKFDIKDQKVITELDTIIKSEGGYDNWVYHTGSTIDPQFKASGCAAIATAINNPQLVGLSHYIADAVKERINKKDMRPDLLAGTHQEQGALIITSNPNQPYSIGHQYSGKQVFVIDKTLVDLRIYDLAKRVAKDLKLQAEDINKVALNCFNNQLKVTATAIKKNVGHLKFGIPLYEVDLVNPKRPKIKPLLSL